MIIFFSLDSINCSFPTKWVILLILTDSGLSYFSCIQLNEGGKNSPSADKTEASQNVENKSKISLCDVGIATGNWGCGAFGGDPEVKTVVQWLAASQVTFPSMSVFNAGFSWMFEM